MILVLDASVLVAALVDSGPDGEWAAAALAGHDLAAPHLMPIEAANILRRAAFVGDITTDASSLAHGDLLELRVELWPYAPLAERSWQLPENVTVYDGTYVALAELLDAPWPRWISDSRPHPVLAAVSRRRARADPGHRAGHESVQIPRQSGDRGGG